MKKKSKKVPSENTTMNPTGSDGLMKAKMKGGKAKQKKVPEKGHPSGVKGHRKSYA